MSNRICKWCDNRVAAPYRQYCDHCKPTIDRLKKRTIALQRRELIRSIKSAKGCSQCGKGDHRQLRLHGVGQINDSWTPERIYKTIMSNDLRCFSCWAKHFGLGETPDYIPGSPISCSRCKKTKEPEEFSPNKGAKTGRTSWCKQCMRENARERNRKNREAQQQA